MISAQPVVEIRNLTKQFGDFTAVDDLTFSVGPGEIFGFLGPNGAGKTTLIKMLTGLHRPTSGTARVAGLDILVSAMELRSRIGYMSQLFSLYGDLTVAENLSLFAGLYGVTGHLKDERTRWALEISELTNRRSTLTGELPLGYKQRLALGCAVLHRPQILFLDEPTSGVDPIARRDFWNLIDQLAQDGTTVFVSTHYMEEAEYCHRLALMNRGRLIALDTPSRLRALMTEPILEIGTDNAPVAVGVAEHLQVVQEASMFGRTLHCVVTDEEEARRVIPRELQAAGLTCDGITVIPPGLEDLFVTLVRQEGGAVYG
jgi:drug efflux transport system ATP-binding protein